MLCTSLFMCLLSCYLLTQSSIKLAGEGVMFIASACAYLLYVQKHESYEEFICEWQWHNSRLYRLIVLIKQLKCNISVVLISGDDVVKLM